VIEDAATSLSAFQIEVSRLFFDLPACRGFLLAGGGALAAQRLTSRPTHDLDFFTADAGAVPAARDEFERAAGARGWRVDRVRDAGTFCRLVVHGPEDLLVDLALDSAAEQPASASIAGPTFALSELAGRKVVALFDRAEARDFADVYALARRYGKQQLLEYAAAVDSGFSYEVFSDMMGRLGRFVDADLPVRPSEVGMVREFFRVWREELAGG
jgi:hypothetical protein